MKPCTNPNCQNQIEEYRIVCSDCWIKYDTAEVLKIVEEQERLEKVFEIAEICGM